MHKKRHLTHNGNVWNVIMYSAVYKLTLYVILSVMFSVYNTSLYSHIPFPNQPDMHTVFVEWTCMAGKILQMINVVFVSRKQK